MTSCSSKPTPLELLAPARDLATAREAILHGADAVYIGAPSHGARARAVNSLDDIRALVEFAAPYGVKVYVTVNTIVYDDEIEDVERMIRRLYSIGVDALIVQDMGILEMDLPPIELHASTQCDTRTPEKARFLEECGFGRIVIARESSLKEICEICSQTSVPVEAFVHGALCVCYSGDCQASFVATGRSANRGECAQMCRLPYDLIDENGCTLGCRKHFLSLKDMCRLDSLAEMADAGVTSFKIEGRLKDASYVKNVTAVYRQALDSLISANPDRYCRASRGEISLNFAPSAERSFNRAFTRYFLRPADARALSTPSSPKALGRFVGTVKYSEGKMIEAQLTDELANGDGLSYIDPTGQTGGFRVNRAERNRISLLDAVQLPAGTRLFRSFDKQWEEKMEHPTATRLIPIDMRLVRNCKGLTLEGRIDGLVSPIAVTADVDLQSAIKPDNGYRRSQLAKLGNTIFKLRNFDDRLGECFVAASTLSDLRRRLAEALTATLRATRRVALRRRVSALPKLPDDCRRVNRHANVANSLARKFYEKAGAVSIEPAIELEMPRKAELTVMITRYCLRRELGKCLRKEGADCGLCPDRAKSWTLRGQGLDYRLDFDCANCRMYVVSLKKT